MHAYEHRAYIYARMRIVFRHDGDSETVRLAAVRLPRTGINVPYCAKDRSAASHVSKRSRVDREFRHSVRNRQSDRGMENGLPPFTRLPRKRKISEIIIDRRLSLATGSGRCAM